MGWWFIPFANLVMPYRAMSELMAGEQPDGGSGRLEAEPTSALLPLWWAVLLVGSAI